MHVRGGFRAGMCERQRMHECAQAGCGVQAQRALRSMLLARVAPLATALQLQPPKPQIEAALQEVLDTLDPSTSVPTMAPRLQDCLVLVMLAAAAQRRMASLAEGLSAERAEVSQLLRDLGLSPELFGCLLGCLVGDAAL
jgi:hypothetical protein